MCSQNIKCGRLYICEFTGSYINPNIYFIGPKGSKGWSMLYNMSNNTNKEWYSGALPFATDGKEHPRKPSGLLQLHLKYSSNNGFD